MTAFAFAFAIAFAALTFLPPAAHAAALSHGGWEHVLPFDLPPAPRGTAPELALVADHLAQDTVVGDGWRLTGLSKIERVSQTEGVPRFDGLDRFRLDGVLLVADPEAAVTGCDFRTEQDSLQCFWYDEVEQVWTARRDGWTWTWGAAASSGPLAESTHAFEWQGEGENAACVADPRLASPDPVAGATGWWLSSVVDPSGNRIEYEYTSPCGLDGWTAGEVVDDHAWQRVPGVIRYNGGDVEVRFVYDERPDVRGTARDGVLRAQPWRLAEVKVVVDANGSEATDAWYQIQYVDEASQGCTGEAAGDGWLGGMSLVKRILRLDPTDPGRHRELRCMEYADDRTVVDRDGLVLLEDEDHESAWNDAFHPMVVNFDGDAWPDLWVIGLGAWWNDGGEMVEDEDFVTSLPAELAEWDITEDPAWMVLDLDRDGATELLHLPAGCSDGGALCGDVYALGSGGRNLTLVEDGVLLDELVLHVSVPADIDGDGFVDLLVRPHGVPGVDFGSDQHQWIRNQGAAPWFDVADIAELVLPLDPDSDAALRTELETAQAACEDLNVAAGFDHDDYQGWPAGQHIVYDGYRTGGGASGLGTWDDADEYAASQYRLGDFNGDGITDLAYALYPCWWSDTDASGEVVLALGPETDPSVAPISRIFYGDGQGGFTDTGLSAGVPWHQETPTAAFDYGFDTELDTYDLYGDTWATAPDYLWSSSEYFSVVDLDRSGAADVLHLKGWFDGSYTGDSGWVSGEDLGLAEGCLPEHVTGLNWETPSGFGTCDSAAAGKVELPDTALREAPLPVASVLPADWNADGFTDLLRVRKGESDPAGYPLQLLLLENQLTTPRGRLSRIHTAFGGTIELAWGMSTASEDNDAVPFVQEVIASVSDQDGLTRFDFQGARFEQGRPRGFRDAVITRQGGAVETLRFAQSPPVAGLSVLRGLRDPDGYLVELEVNLPLTLSSSSALMDAEAPFFNPVQRTCHFTLQRGAGPSEADLVEECLAYRGMAASGLAELAVAMGWEEGPAPVVWNAVWGIEPEPALSVGDASGVGVVPWTVELPSPTGMLLTATDGPLPPELAVPDVPAWSLPVVANPTWKLQVQDTSYGSLQRPVRIDDWRDVSLSEDDLITRLSWSGLASTAWGTRLLSRQVESGSGTILGSTEFELYGDFDRPGRVRERGAGLVGSRVWLSTWAAGERVSQTDPDLAVTTWQRNSCGLPVQRTDPALRVEHWDYDPACRLVGHNWQGGQEDLERDGYAEVPSFSPRRRATGGRRGRGDRLLGRPRTVVMPQLN